MGLSRNKVAVSEGAAGSPPFYGESESVGRRTCRGRGLFVVQFPGIDRDLNGGVAHLGERLNGIQEVEGSNPFVSTTSRANRKRGDLDERQVH